MFSHLVKVVECCVCVLQGQMLRGAGRPLTPSQQNQELGTPTGNGQPPTILQTPGTGPTCNAEFWQLLTDFVRLRVYSRQDISAMMVFYFNCHEPTVVGFDYNWAAELNEKKARLVFLRNEMAVSARHIHVVSNLKLSFVFQVERLAIRFWLLRITTRAGSWWWVMEEASVHQSDSCLPHQYSSVRANKVHCLRATDFCCPKLILCRWQRFTIFAQCPGFLFLCLSVLSTIPGARLFHSSVLRWGGCIHPGWHLWENRALRFVFSRLAKI